VSNSDCAHEAGLSPGILSKFVQCVDSVSVAKIGEFSSAIFLKLFSFPRLCLQFSVVGSTAVFQGAATAVWFHFVFVVVGHRTVFFACTITFSKSQRFVGFLLRSSAVKT
jgi:hypothetical protein